MNYLYFLAQCRLSSVVRLPLWPVLGWRRFLCDCIQILLMVARWAVTHIGFDLGRDARRNAGNARSIGIVAKKTPTGVGGIGKLKSTVKTYPISLITAAFSENPGLEP
jgi:hypothetical protein